MKKIILNIAIIGMMAGVSFAAADMEKPSDKSFFEQIKNLFVKEVAPVVQPVQTPAIQMKAAVIIAASTTATSSENLDVMINASGTAATPTSENFLCLDQKKFINKKTKTERAIKDQTDDKNKITKSLIKLEASVDTKSAAKIKDKRLQLDAEVKDVTDIEINIINIASGTVDIACDTDEKKTISENILKIKKLDAEVVIEAEDVTNLIQKDIKVLLRNIK